MSTPTQILPDHHRHCDELFAAAEEAALNGDWDAAAPAFERFNAQMIAHFDAEETLLFPAFEAASGMSAGPTQMMRQEHDQMRGLLAQLAVACDARDSQGYGGSAETLLMLMQQHNMKEEQMLYDLADRQLGDRAPEILKRIQER